MVTMTHEEAVRAASQLMNKKVKAKDLKNEIAGLEERLRNYVEETDDKELGKVMAYERMSTPKLTGATGKKLEAQTEILCNLLDDKYVQRKPRLADMAAHLKFDKELKVALKEVKLKIVQETNTYFKHVG